MKNIENEIRFEERREKSRETSRTKHRMLSRICLSFDILKLTAVLTLIAFAVFITIALIPTAISQDGINFCCEKTTYGAWCQNEVREKCDEAYKISPTACDSTSYCKRGCCYDSQEGLCMENTPQRICQDSEGTWKESAQCSIPQCELGCCILGDQAALVTMTRCKALSGFYSLDTNFRQDITDELICIATANAQDKGACVFEDPESHSPTCKFSTRAECGAPVEGQVVESEEGLEIQKPEGSVKAFYKDILCSAEELGTVCAPSKKTMMIDGRDEVFYADTCGNPANIYDASKYNDDNYWTYVKTKSESCGYGKSNAGSKTCGNCDYYLGSIGKKSTVGTGRATYGDYICVDLGCKGHEHGESWCGTDSGAGGKGTDKVGSRYYRYICLNNEILTEPCSDFRNEVCVESSASGISEAGCVVNRWQDCMQQQEQDDCENSDMRDCMWMEGYYFGAKGTTEGSGMGVGVSILQNAGKSNEKKITSTGLCAPAYTPGFAFWGEQGSSVTSANKFTPSASTIGTGKTITSLATEDSGDETNTETDAEKETGGAADSATAAESKETQKFSNIGQSIFGTGAVTPKTSVSPADSCSAADIELTINFKSEKSGGFDSWGEWECKGEAMTDAYDYAYDYAKGFALCEYFKDGELTNPGGLAGEFNSICAKIGDCGGKANWAGKETSDGYALYYRGERVAGAGGAEVLEEPKKEGAAGTGSAVTGNVIGDFFKSIYDKIGGGDN